MTIASLFLALMIVTSAADAPGVDPVLLDFQATWCGPCREMRPEVEKLERAHYPIQQVDIDRSPELAQRYNVTAVPTFIVADRRGRVLARTAGKMPAGQLAKFFNDAVEQAEAAAPAADNVEAQATATRDAQAEPAAGREAAEEVSTRNPNPWETVVRIKMHLSKSEWGYGSGTIIYSDADESIILTCAHIFKGRDDRFVPVRNFRTQISVDLFSKDFVSRKPDTLGCIQQNIAGEAIDYDPVNDVGLIRIRPGRRLAASRVVPETWEPRKGLDMITMGCSHGNDATAWSTRIINPVIKMETSDKKSFYEMQCTNAPKQGRSGGGIYTRDGYVAGVCDFADPNGNVGLYATPKAIYKLLDRANYTALYRPSAAGSGAMLARANGKEPIIRGQSPSDESAPTPTSRELTIPPPGMVGIPIPEAKVASNTNHPAPRWNSDPEANPRASRPNRRPEIDRDLVDPGARASKPQPQLAGLAGTPNSDDAPAAEPEARRDDAPAPARRPSNSKWKPVRNGRPGAN